MKIFYMKTIMSMKYRLFFNKIFSIRNGYFIIILSIFLLIVNLCNAQCKIRAMSSRILTDVSILPSQFDISYNNIYEFSLEKYKCDYLKKLLINRVYIIKPISIDIRLSFAIYNDKIYMNRFGIFYDSKSEKYFKCFELSKIFIHLINVIPCFPVEKIK
jgi:hypothetical protein